MMLTYPCSMLAIYDRITANAIVREQSTIQSVISRPIIISENVLFLLHGIFRGNLALMKDSQAYLYGTLYGDIINRGGHLEVFGTVNGKIIREFGDIVVGLDADVRDGVY